MWLVGWFVGCGDPEPGAVPSPAPAPAVAAAPAAGGLHGSHSEHMQQMAATRDRLRQELGPAYDAPVPGLAAADPAAGRVTFAATCAPCHGDAGKGDGPAGRDLNPPPSDFTDAFHARYYSDAGRLHLVRKGSPGTGMAGFEGALEEQQLLDVYRYVADLRGPAAK